MQPHHLQFASRVPWHTLSDLSSYFMSHRCEDGASAHFDPVFHSIFETAFSRFIFKIQDFHECFEILVSGIYLLRLLIGHQKCPSPLTWNSFVYLSHSLPLFLIAAPFFDVCPHLVIDACRDLLSAFSQSQMNKWIDHLYDSERARLGESFLSGKQTLRC